MNNAYRKMMEQQCLTDGAQQAFYEKMQGTQPRKRMSVFAVAAAIAACVCLLIPVTALAVENIFGISFVEFFERSLTLKSAGEGYDINFTGVYSRPISEFSSEIQSIDGNKTVAYDSWEEAEAEMGIDLITNSILSDEETHPEKSYDLQMNSEGHILGSNLHHCFADYEGKDGQLYRAAVTAAYTRNGMYITVSTTVTAEHPEIPQEKEVELHRRGITYLQEDVEQMSQEQYAAKNGINATIIEVDWTIVRATDYEASFSANGASYRITVSPNAPDQGAQAKALLIEILEGFVF